MPRGSRSEQGFTLTELLLVCGILALLLLLAVPSYAAMRDNARVRGATSVLTADIRWAQEKAVREGLATRVVFETLSGHYRVEQADSAGAPISCSNSGFTTLKQVNLGAEFQVQLKGPTFKDPLAPETGCVVFEPGGRADWVSPMPRQVTQSAQGGTVIGWYFDNEALNDRDSVAYGDAAVYWDAMSVPMDGYVRLTLDFGRPVYVDSICPQMVEDLATVSQEVAFPNLFRVRTSTSTGATIPTNWDPPIEVQRSGYEETRVSPDWARACPWVQLNTTTRYVHLEFEVADGGSGPSLAIEEIRIPWPQITVENNNGRAARKVIVTPNTGRVLIQQ